MAWRFFYPRPEYPRPERQRGTVEGYDWLNLNGPWQFRFDGERKGIEEKWFSPETGEWRQQIIVPFCWESLAAWGEGDSAGNDNYYSTRVFRNPLEVTRANHRAAARYEVGWYRRVVEIPRNEAWEDKRFILTVGAADFFTDCWCNGVHLGHHEGGYTPFEFDLTNALQAEGSGGRALLVLRVEDPMNNAEQPVGKQWRWYTTTSGIWQTVFVEPRHRTHLNSFRVEANADSGTAQFTFKCEEPGKGCAVGFEITGPDGTRQKGEVALDSGIGRQEVKLRKVLLWDPNSPNLYGLVLRVRQDDRVVDTVRSYFGVRSIDFELAQESGVPAAIRVNGKPRYLRGALYQSYYPDGVYTVSSVETLKGDIQSAKNFGFNFLRVHIKVDDPLLLYWADKLGILMMADFPNFGEGGDTALGRGRFETMMRETIERDFNHPSIFAWCLFNETWGFGGQRSFQDVLLTLGKESGTAMATGLNSGGSAGESHAVAQRPKWPAKAAEEGLSPPQNWVQQMWELAKQLDTTRLVEDMSVCHWEHLEYYLHCDTDINSWHFYLSDYNKAKAHIDKVVSSTFLGSSFNYVPGFLHKGQPLINSEYGGVGALDGDRDMSWSFKFLTNELRRHQQIAAYIYTELTDVEWEYNGFLNYDRTPKEFGYDPRVINESNALPVDSPPVQRLAPGATISLEVASAHFSTRRYENVWLHWEIGGIDSRGHLHQDVARGRKQIAFPHRMVAPAHNLRLTMPRMPMLCTLQLSACTADGVVVARNFLHYFVSESYPAEREEAERLLILRGLPGKWAQAEWSGGCGERQKNQAEDACYGQGHGFFEWVLPLDGAEFGKAHRVRLLCEASSHRADAPQTDADVFPTVLQMLLNGVKLYEAVVKNHPHDSRGVLSYWRGGVGAYGYLAQVFIEGELLAEVNRHISDGVLRLRCAVPADALAQGGLTIYGAECGRFPVCPTVMVEW